MNRIAIIGAGGYVFPLRLIGDILSFPELQACTLALMDIDANRLEATARAARELIAHHRLSARVETTTDQREALRGARFVIVTFQVGGLEAYQLDVDIPRRYGLDQPVGDTLGPGGVFRFLRSAPALERLARDVRDLCPEALVINYANPMAMNCLYLARLGVRVVGLCHSVQGTSRMLARAIGVPIEELRFKVAGINHQAWFLEFRRDQGGVLEDLYPRLREVMFARHLSQQEENLAPDSGDHSTSRREDNVYEGGSERVRTEIMHAFGYFHTESSHHASEYLPYFRKNPETVLEFIPQRWDYFVHCSRHHDPADLEKLLLNLKASLEPSLEYGARIIHAVTTNAPAVIHGNVINDRAITNLPEQCCVEVACLVDGGGVQPTHAGMLPPQCAAVNLSNISVQRLAVEAAITGKREHVHHAVALDPLSGALLTLGRIRQMVDELLEAQTAWLPRLTD